MDSRLDSTYDFIISTGVSISNYNLILESESAPLVLSGYRLPLTLDGIEVIEFVKNHPFGFSSLNMLSFVTRVYQSPPKRATRSNFSESI